MKNALIILILIAAAAAGWYVLVYEKPGPVEQLGRDIDQKIDQIKHGDETAVEKATRKTREATEEVKEKLEK